MFHKILLGALFFSSTFAFLTPQNGLDINCWTGESTKSLSTIHSNIKFVGIDKHERVIDVAIKRYPLDYFANIDIESDGLPVIGFFDIVRISRYDNLKNMLENVWTIVRKGGVITIIYKKEDIDHLNDFLEKNQWEYYYFDEIKMTIMK